MHMSDALISPIVGGSLWAISMGIGAYALRQHKNEELNSKIALSGVAGAFVFSAQMVNFTIPGTGSSGHIGGGLLLAALLGPRLAFLTLSSVLLIQSLLFADGGILAYGCNVFNMAAISCFIAYPLLFKPLLGKTPSKRRLAVASVTAATIGLQLGSGSVVIETLLSGQIALPTTLFIGLMQGIHLLIGLVEGVATFAILNYLYEVRPEILQQLNSNKVDGGIKPVLKRLVGMTILTAGGFSLLASSQPDGLEWSLEHTVKSWSTYSDHSLHSLFERIQGHLSIFPDYQLGTGAPVETSIAGVIGSLATLCIVWVIGWGYKKWSLKKS